MPYLSKLIGRSYLSVIFIWGTIAQAIPSKEEALKRLSDCGMDPDIINKISDIKTIDEISKIKPSPQDIRCWLDIDRFISQCPEADKSMKLDIYYYWLVVGLRQLNPLINEEYTYIEQALKKADSISKRSPLEEMSDFGLKLAELKFIYLFGPDAYTDFFKNFALKRMEESKNCFHENNYELIKSWSEGSTKDRLTIFNKILSDIYLRCEDEILSTELMFYWIGFAMHSVTQSSCCLNGKINIALNELVYTENLLQEKIGCSVEKLRKMLQYAQTITLQKNRRVKFGEDLCEAHRIRSLGSAPLPHTSSFKGQHQPFIKMSKQPQSF